MLHVLKSHEIFESLNVFAHIWGYDSLRLGKLEKVVCAEVLGFD